uniref:Uncharacterized protein n=1 Tax=Setaria italica TaxID=4555 RepID=K3YBF7_SETIT
MRLASMGMSPTTKRIALVKSCNKSRNMRALVLSRVLDPRQVGYTTRNPYQLSYAQFTTRSFSYQHMRVI